MGQDTHRASITQSDYNRAFGSSYGIKQPLTVDRPDERGSVNQRNRPDKHGSVNQRNRPEEQSPVNQRSRPKEQSPVNQRSRPKEQSPVQRRNRPEVSSPTSVSLGQRLPNTPKQHPSNQPSKNVVDPLVRCDASRAQKRVGKIQEQNQYRPSDYTSSSDLLSNQKTDALDEITKADKRIAEADDKITSAMQAVLQNISGGWIKNTVASEVMEPPKATLCSIQKTKKKDMEMSFKNDIAGLQQSMKEQLESGLSELKMSLAQEDEQRLSSLKRAWGEEEERRISSLRVAWGEEEERRISCLKDKWSREEERRIGSLKDEWSREEERRIGSLEEMWSREEERRISSLRGAWSQEEERRIGSLKESWSQEEQKRISSLGEAWRQEEERRISSLKDMWSQEEQKRICSLEGAWSREKEKRIEELNGVLSEQVAKSESLGKKVTDLEDRLDKAASEQKKLLELLNPQEESVKPLETHVDLLEEDSSKIEELARQAPNRSEIVEKGQQKGNLIAHLVSLDSALSKLLATWVGNTTADVAGTKVCVENLSLNMQSFGSSMRDLSSSVQDLDLKVQGLSSSHEPATVSDEKILEVIRPELTEITSNTRDMIMGLKKNIFAFLIQDRQKIEALEEQCSGHTRHASIPVNVERSTFGQGLDESFGDRLGINLTKPLNEEFDKVLQKVLDEKLNEKLGSKQSENKKLVEELNKKLTEQDEKCTDKIKYLEEEFTNRIDTTINSFDNTFEGISLQLQGLNTWQNNFNTKGLYRDIVNHINSTLPSSTTVQIGNLGRRVEVIEKRILTRENTPSNKRRKLSGGGSRVVNSHPTDV